MKAGPLKYRIGVQRFATVELPSGEESKQWADYTSAYAEISFGTGKERREAAQETASAPATFYVRRNAETATITPADRVTFDGSDWDISSVSPSREFHAGLDIVATRRTA